MSCASPAMSTRSGSQPSPIAMPRPICATSSECVSRVRGVSLSPGADHLRLVGQPTQRRAVQHPRPVAGEIGAVLGVGSGQRGTLRLFDHQTLPVEVVVSVVIVCHRR